MIAEASLPLDGLDGTNPMGFLAGLGVLAILDHREVSVRLAWSTGVVPRGRLAGIGDIDELVAAVLEDKEGMEDQPLLNFPPDSPASDVKFPPEELRAFLAACRAVEPSASLSAALVCETVLDNSGKAKPTDLHFTAGQQRFLDMVRELREQVTDEHVREALLGPWTYTSTLKSFMWDTADDRDYALAATNPASTTKTTVPGADWLAFRGLALLPVMPGRERTLTPGAGGDWKSGWFTWPLWAVRANASTVRSLMQVIPRRQDIRDAATFGAWGIHRMFRSRVFRSAQGGYGTFRPSTVVWSAPERHDHAHASAV